MSRSGAQPKPLDDPSRLREVNAQFALRVKVKDLTQTTRERLQSWNEKLPYYLAISQRPSRTTDVGAKVLEDVEKALSDVQAEMQRLATLLVEQPCSVADDSQIRSLCQGLEHVEACLLAARQNLGL